MSSYGITSHKDGILGPDERQACPKADLVKAFDNYAKGFHDGYGERNGEIEKLRGQLVLAKRALEAIQRATINGEVCDDVAWFDQITTLHDFCDLTLSRLTDDYGASK